MSDASTPPAIRVDRLRTLLDGVNGFGRSQETGGFNRPAFSDADMDARSWFAGEMEAAGLEVSRDGAGNLIGRWGAGEGPVIMAGSHLDTVLEGGAFDGTLGACLALESVRALKEAGVEPRLPVEVVVTSDEEGRFGGMLGSQAIAGQITGDWVARAVDDDGVTLDAAMSRQDMESERIVEAARPHGSIAAFLELHIEQGPVLKSENKSVGIVESVSGLCNWQITLTGAANHSGTTPMSMRADAFAGLADIAATIPSIIRIVGRADTRVTIGKVDISPNHAHTIPGKAVFNLIVRDPDEAVMRAVTAALRALIERIAGNRKLSHSIDQMSWLSPVSLDPGLADRIDGEAQRLGIDAMRMVSGAGHDAQTMQSVCPSALIFVPSEGGVSHAPQERTDWADIEKSAELYLAALHNLCMAPPTARPAPAGDEPAAGAVMAGTAAAAGAVAVGVDEAVAPDDRDGEADEAVAHDEASPPDEAPVAESLSDDEAGASDALAEAELPEPEFREGQASEADAAGSEPSEDEENPATDDPRSDGPEAGDEAGTAEPEDSNDAPAGAVEDPRPGDPSAEPDDAPPGRKQDDPGPEAPGQNSSDQNAQEQDAQEQAVREQGGAAASKQGRGPKDPGPAPHEDEMDFDFDFDDLLDDEKK